jgi:hypothetical protein
MFWFVRSLVKDARINSIDKEPHRQLAANDFEISAYAIENHNQKGSPSEA